MPRQIVEDKYVSDTIDAACQISGGLHDAWEGLKWFLAREAESGANLGIGRNASIHKQQGIPLRHIPTITVLYEYDAHSVFIRSVKLQWDDYIL
jgi:hypothetical protein